MFNLFKKPCRHSCDECFAEAKQTLDDYTEILEENQRLISLLRSSYGYVKAHEHEGSTKRLLLSLEQFIGSENGAERN